MYLFEHYEVCPVDEVEDDEDGGEHDGAVLVQLQHSAALRAALLGLTHFTLQLRSRVIWAIMQYGKNVHNYCITISAANDPLVSHNCFSQSQRSRRLLLVFSWLKVTTSAFTLNTL